MSHSKKDESSMPGVLQEFIKINRLQAGINRVNARNAWEDLMGNGVNKYTTRVELRNDTLYVSLSSSVLREELSLGKTEIIAMLNKELRHELIKNLVLR
jgi:hypothetical protein